MARTVTDMTILLEVIVGSDPADAATARSAGHLPAGYQPFLKQDGLRQVRLGILRQVCAPQVTDPRILADFEPTIAELTAAGGVGVAPPPARTSPPSTATAIPSSPMTRNRLPMLAPHTSAAVSPLSAACCNGRRSLCRMGISTVCPRVCKYSRAPGMRPSSFSMPMRTNT